MAFQLRPLSPLFGAEVIGLDLGRPLPDPVFDQLLQAWRQHLVLLFRDQKVGDAALVDFARNFGDLDAAPVGDNKDGAIPPGYPEITVVSNVVENGRHLGALASGELTWHSDMTYKPEPPVGCVLHAWEASETQGFTWFSSLRAATVELPAELRRRIEGRQSFHDGSYTSAGTLRHGYAAKVDPTRSPGHSHPFLVRHPSWGEEVLLLGRRPNGVVLGLDAAASDALLDELWAHATRERYAFRHAWRPGDILIWDNLLTLHRRDAFDPAIRRTLHRAQILRLHPQLRAAA
jgi:taurine dioxygenase